MVKCCTYLKNSSRSASSSSLRIYLTVLSNLGIMTCSIAFTRRFVARITSSSIVNAVWRDASSTRVSKALAYTSRDLRICCPPRPRPVRLKSSRINHKFQWVRFAVTIVCIGACIVIKKISENIISEIRSTYHCLNFDRSQKLEG